MAQRGEYSSDIEQIDIFMNTKANIASSEGRNGLWEMLFYFFKLTIFAVV